MSNAVKIEVEGFDRLTDQLKRLADDKDKKKEVLLILKQVAKPTLLAAKGTAPIAERKHTISGSGRTKKIIQPGNLKKSIGYIIGKKGNAVVNPTVYVGPRTRGSADGWYGGMVHEGHNIYAVGFKRKHIKGANDHAAKKRTKKQLYMTEAYEQTNGTVTADAEKRMVAFIQRRIDKLS